MLGLTKGPMPLACWKGFYDIYRIWIWYEYEYDNIMCRAICSFMTFLVECFQCFLGRWRGFHCEWDALCERRPRRLWCLGEEGKPRYDHHSDDGADHFDDNNLQDWPCVLLDQLVLWSLDDNPHDHHHLPHPHHNLLLQVGAGEMCYPSSKPPRTSSTPLMPRTPFTTQWVDPYLWGMSPSRPHWQMPF